MGAGLRVRLVAALAALLALGAGAWLALGGGHGEEAEPRARRDAPGERAGALASAPREISAVVGVEGRERREASTPPTTRADERRAPADGASVLRGRVLAPDGEPREGARVEVLRRPGASFQDLDLELAAEVIRVAEDATGADGGFAFELPLDREFELAVRAEGHPVERVTACRAGDEVVVRLRHGALLFGRVARAADHVPVAGALVRLRPDPEHGGASTGERRETRTDVAGAYRLEELAPGSWSIEVVPPRDAAPRATELELAEGEALRHDVAVEPGAVVRGRVTDAVTGRPIEGAEVGETWTFRKSVRTDAHGEYVLEGLSPFVLDLEVRAEGYGRTERALRSEFEEPVPERVDVELLPARGVRGRVVDVEGLPIAQAYVAAVASEYPEDGGQRTDWRSTRSGADGRFHVVGMRPDLRHALVARHPGYGAIVHDLSAAELERPELDVGDVVLPPAAAIVGRVVDEAGAGIAGLEVRLLGTNADRGRFAERSREETWSLDWYVAERSTRTGSAGGFAFANVAPGSYDVSTLLPGTRTGPELQVEVASGERVEDIELVLARGLSVSGRVVAGDGGSVPKVYVSVDAEAGDGEADVPADPDGGFVATGLPPGTYTLTAYPYPTPDDRLAGRIFASELVRGVSAGQEGVVLVLPLATLVAGRVVDADGRPVEGSIVSALDPPSEQILAFDETDPAGGFTLRLAEERPVDLVARPPRAGDAPRDSAALTRLRGFVAGSGAPELRLAWRP
jgi:protocatechuate 3,4-dioxygenase beta subunit